MAAEGLATLTTEKALLAGVTALRLPREVSAPGEALQAKLLVMALLALEGLFAAVPSQLQHQGRSLQEYPHPIYLSTLAAHKHAACAPVGIAWALLVVSVSFGGSGSVPLLSLLHLAGECSSVGVPCWEKGHLRHPRQKASSHPQCLP